jgi:Asp-tRNA(Asn)/Glu-tRNA(Gln) amidotransferase A subunit family amidase
VGPEDDALDATALARAIREGRVSPVDAVERALDAIAAYDAELNACTVTFADEARRAAWEAERRRGEPATNGSLALRDFRPGEDSVVVARLRDAGAIIVGKTNNPEFLYRSYTDNALFGPTRNPWDPSRTPGGSSGGSAAAVAAGMGALSLGTDGGGSIRIPACFCNLVGHKPTFGLVPKLPGFRGWPTLPSTAPSRGQSPTPRSCCR